jgi:hypothetical protein
VNPIGLTRAEEEKEQTTAPLMHQPPAPAGTRQCVATLPPDGAVCGAEARWLVVWRDPESPKSPACTDCAKRFQALARSHGSDIGVEPLP